MPMRQHCGRNVDREPLDDLLERQLQLLPLAGPAIDACRCKI
jgi:hypothetical protein